MFSRFALALVCLAFIGNGFTEEKRLTLVGDSWCPFNCSDQPGNRGILVERAAAALAEEGFEVNYIEVPWTRSIAGVREAKYDAIVGTGPSETPDFHFPPEPLAIAHHSFYTLPSRAWEYQGLQSLEDVRIGVVQDYSYGGLYEEYIKKHQDNPARVVTLSGDRALPRLINMLSLGRIDAFIEAERVLNYQFNSAGRTNPLRHAGLAYKENLYVAFSPALDNGRELAAALGRGMAKANQSP
ncbi:transporter substrate-binding domain-containing protein [Marinobacter alexandrii]|uniref:substrate-binding periplasmic protein n=1 Tax=Marinobacter alexandrii TaxID=2570351 RepID=UPI002ABE8C59|nr:transporter substrate-binding domain-containing protein [Marinobacter alexandrii]